MNNAQRRFTAEELEIIRTLSPSEAHKLLPHRSRHVLSAMKHQLRHPERRLSTKKGKFSTHENEMMRMHYPTMPNRDLIAKYLPGRSDMQITGRAKYLKLRKAYVAPVVFEGSKAIVEQINAFARSKGLSTMQLDKLCGTDSYFHKNWRNYWLNMGAITRALELLGGQFRAVFVEEVNAGRLVKTIDKFSQPLAPVKKQRAKAKRPPAASRLVGKAKNNPTIIKAVEAIVPRGLPDRDDIVQTLLLALHDGSLAPEQLTDRKRVRAIITAVRKSNREQSGFAASFDAPGEDGRTLHDKIARDTPDDGEQEAA
jgi:hypothetical protein